MAIVDIIIPLYNKESTISRAIRSILTQTFQDWRLIIVNDGSTDNSLAKVKQFTDSRIHVINQENQGPGAARNAGIDIADSEYLAFLDADDEWLEFYLENAVSAMKESDVSMVGTMYYEWPKKISMEDAWRIRGIIPAEYYLRGDETAEFAESLLFFCHVGNVLIKTEAAQKADGFYAKDHCRFAEDTTFFLRTVFNEGIRIIGPAAVCHHREASNLSNKAKYPLAPFLLTPEIVLKYCPYKKRELMQGVLDRIALRAARRYARRGYKKEAVELIDRFPGVKTLKGYRKCIFEISASYWFKYWVALKCTVGPKARGVVRVIARMIGVMKKVPDFDKRNNNEHE